MVASIFSDSQSFMKGQLQVDEASPRIYSGSAWAQSTGLPSTPPRASPWFPPNYGLSKPFFRPGKEKTPKQKKLEKQKLERQKEGWGWEVPVLEARELALRLCLVVGGLGGVLAKCAKKRRPLRPQGELTCGPNRGTKKPTPP